MVNDFREIRCVRVYDMYFSDAGLLVEYLIETEVGEVSAKLIYSDNPALTLRKYYEHETERRERLKPA